MFSAIGYRSPSAVTAVAVEQIAVHPLRLETEMVIMFVPTGKRVVRSTWKEAGGLLAESKFVWTAIPFITQTTIIGSPLGSFTITETVPVLPVDGVQLKVSGGGHVIVGAPPLFSVIVVEQFAECPLRSETVTTI